MNYNSMRFRDIMLQSLDSFMSLDFDDYELIIVDNASSDGSFELIKRHVEEVKPSNLRVKFVRSDSNLGYAGGMNLGWDARDPEARYVAFVNNDLIAEPESLRRLVDAMEGDEKLGAASGLIYYGDGKTILTAGGYVSETWRAGNICNGALPEECPGIGREHYITWPSGEYMVVRVDAVRKAMPHGKPFINETFLYLDDNLLGLVLWNKGFRVKYIPVKTGKHHANMTTRGTTSTKYVNRSVAALMSILRTRYSNTVIQRLLVFKRSVGNKVLCNLGLDEYCARYVGFVDGIRLGKLLIDMLGILDLYRAPYVPVNTYEALYQVFSLKYGFKYSHGDLRLPGGLF